MKYLLLFLFSLSFTTLTFAQPANDDCLGIINLGDAPACPSTVFTNVGATATDIGNDNLPTCFGTAPDEDVWFSFTATAAIVNYEITVTGVGGNPILQPEISLYRGDCGFDQLVLLDCIGAQPNETSLTIGAAGLTPGITYFVRIDAGITAGDFEICVQEMVQTEFSIDQTGSDLCEGTLYDTGGPTGNYGTNENHIFSICPPNPTGCLVFSLSQYNMDNGSDALIFYDGPDVNSPIITSIQEGASLANDDNIGGVCFEVAAPSGCLTVQFISNGFLELEGFLGTWECVDDCEPSMNGIDLELAPDLSQIATALENPYFDITVTDINCNEQSYAVFNQGDNTTLGMNDGLVLTTGSAANISNPASFHSDIDLNGNGDADLDFLDDEFGVAFSFGTSDACVVELEVFAKTNLVGFDYIFGSEEYEEDFSVFSDDLVAILIEGGGITGLPGLNGQANLAWVPGSSNTQLVQVQQINASNNWEYFRNNLNSPDIVYNGLSSDFLGAPKTLYAGTDVIPCETYNVKIAIGDTDANDDSGLFVQASEVGYPILSLDYNTGIDYFVEGCTNITGEIVIRFSEALDTDFTPNVTIGGTATPLLDYTITIPTNPTIPAGTTEISFPITITDDGIVEGTETIEIALTGDFGCGEVIYSSIMAEIKDELEVSIIPDLDTVFVCDGIFTADLAVTGAASYSWSPAAVFSDPNGASTVATIANDQTVSVTGTLGTCTATDEVFLQIITPIIDIAPDGPLQICEGDIVSLDAANNVNNEGLVWSPIVGLSEPGSPQTEAQPTLTTTYTATVTTGSGCSASDEILINVESFSFPEWVVGDSIICQNSTVQLAASVSNSTTDYQWSPSTGLDVDTIPNAMATPDVTTTYTLTATSENGLCEETATVTITVLPADVDIVPDTINLCLGDSTFIQAMTSTGGAGVTWSPIDSLTIIDAENVLVKPVVSFWYYANLVVGTCSVTDSVFVRVDSLPQMTGIEAIPFKESYCEGEIISLVSPNYEPAFFPDIMFQWEPTTGAISEDSLFNLAISALTTTTYIREITNNACSIRDTIDIEVIPVANLEIMPENPVICPGESVQLNVTADQPIDSWEWMPSDGLSCADCTDPVASPPSTITYQVEGEFMGCPSVAQVTIEVTPPPVYAFPAVPFVCLGDAISLNETVDPNADYVWTNEDGSLLSNDAQPSVMPNVTTTYNLSVSIGDCPAITDAITITVQEDYMLSVGADQTVCEDEDIVLEATATDASVSLTWMDANGQTLPGNMITGGTLVPGSSNTFTVTSSDPAGCFPYMGQLSVVVYPDFEITASDDQNINGGESVTLMASTDLTGVTFTWQNDLMEVIGEGNSVTVAPCNTQVYTVTGTHPNGCPGDTEEVIVNVVSSFTVDSLGLMQIDSLGEIYEGAEVSGITLTTPETVNGATYEWFINDLLVATTSNSESGSFNIPELAEGTEMQDARLVVVVTNGDGCSQSLSLDITILNNPVEVPNVFTPNNDGTNDLFSTISRVPVDVRSIRIWNRWGKLVYDNEDQTGEWDGTFKDKPASSDVYIYEIQYSILGASTLYSESGNVTLLR